ncbi:NAD(P)H-dependent oxidoreductase [Streptomyces sp. DSM 44915]|uniref:NAD(P)H-dependent oxidoreductase n=1 Tax=Streptomyces chisholmiae TaxID=3075540 RepID=A0ABU2JPI5_9ACTN|nr:NAD(P)H-dependent oxidoreductase [Streptomyces sp. DSM 44915]MDT0266638.1 NAD(P)H-dependent oxidoreductase [Streptomyces sp. DSM 44915]
MSVETPPSVIALSGNPRPGSRTVSVAERLAETLAREVLPGSAVATVDLAAVGPEVLAPEHPAADAALATLTAARLVVVATPVYKASYTGLLKSFLDLLPADGLLGVTAVPLVIAGSPGHALAGEVHLRPLLVELGATVATRSVVVTEPDLADPAPVIDAWLATARPALRRAVGTTVEVVR